MHKNFRRLFAAALSAAMLPVSGIVPNMGISVSAVSAGTVVRLNPSEASPFNNGEFAGWGTSLCWWANRLGYSEALTKQSADAFFSEDGLGLDIARYNLGGGDDPTHDHVNRSDSKVPGVWKTFELSEDGNDVNITEYDLTKDQNQLNIAKAALAANPNLYFEGFSNSAPYFMTVTGCTGGGDPADSDNLKADMYDDFGKFIADATKLFKEQGIEFKSYSPMNEPDTNYWGVNSPKQEGCHFSPGESQSKAIVETRKALDAAGLTDVLVAGMDETDINKTVSNYSMLTEEAKAALGRIDTHTYSGSNRAGAKSTAVNAGKDLWMSEVDGGWNMFGLADRIILDMNGMQPAAWVMWDIVDKHRDSNFVDPTTGNKTEADAALNATDSLWGVGMGNHDTQTLELSNKYYGFGQFTKYINPGDTIIASSNSSLAAYNKKTGDIKIVASNSSSADKPYTFDLSAFTNVGTAVEEIRSNNATGDSAEHWAEIEGEAVLADKKISTTLKAGTITTYIVKGNGPTNYAYINGGGNEIERGAAVQLTINKNFDGDAVWSSSDENIASVDSNGLVTAKNSGTVTITAKIGDFTASREFTIPMYKLSGTASWGNDSNRPADSADYRKAADGDLSTYFDGTTGGWVEYDYGAAFKPSVIKLAARSGNGMAERTVGAKIQASNDGINWTDLYTVSSALPADSYTEITADKLADSKAYRYFRYINEKNMANIAEFLIDGQVSDDVPANAPQINDIKALSDNFENISNIFGAQEGTLAGDGIQVYDSNLERYGKVFVPVRTAGSAELDEAVTLTNKDIFRMEFDMFAGWESSGKSNTLSLKDKDGNEIAGFTITGGGYNFNEIRIGGKNVLSGATIAQCRSNPGSSNKAGANGWNASGQPYVNTVGYNKHVTILIEGTGSVTIKAEGGMEDTAVTGVLTRPISVKSLEVQGDFNSARERVVSYDNLDTDVITYSSPLAEPTATPGPTDPPVLPESGELISLNFDNGDLTSTSSYGKALGTPNFVTDGDNKCVQFDGTRATAITLTDANGNGLLTGRKNFTIQFKVKPTASGTSWWFFTAPNADTQQHKEEKYIGAMTGGGTLTVERYNNSGSRSAVSMGTYKENEWNDVIIVVKDGVTELYVNGVRSKDVESAVDAAELLGENPVAYIGLANWGTGEFASGYLDDFVIYDGAKENPLAEIDLGDLSAVKSDLTLPAALVDGTIITWTSSDSSVIANDGKVTRQAETKNVVLTASVTVDGETSTRDFAAAVIGLAASVDNFTAYAEGNDIKYTSSYNPDEDIYNLAAALYDADGRLLGVQLNSSEGSFAGMPGTYKVSAYLWKDMEPMHEVVSKSVKVEEAQEMSAYLFAHFVNNEGDASCEQIYFSVSQDGQNWTTLNNKQPVLTSTVGEKGVRDPHIIRGEDGKYFVIATDLSIYNRRGDENRWETCQREGSQSIVIWESEDMVNWSDARLVKVAPDNAGCTWAPEAVYDADKGMYMVFWASKIADDNYSTQRMYRSYTKDFVTFTEPEIYIDGGNISNIDTTIISDKGVYYRFTKNESKASVTMMASTSIDKGWKDVETYTINGAAGNTVTGYEGPTIYKMNGEDRWTLLLDYYSRNQGYKPFVTSDITKGEFTSASDFNMDMTYRHGTVMPITKAEYDRLVEAYK
ncbi:MAG: glycoside hydrolase [bacterium]|nr:glycoside hydrolase [bacterium]